MNARSRLRWVAVAALTALPSGVATAANGDDPNATCEGCHAALWGEFFELANGDTLPAWVSPETTGGSVHGAELECADCHREMNGYPHDAPVEADARAYRIAMSDTCAHCHYKHARWVEDGIHFAYIAGGDPEAPTCVDCHGAHDIAPAHLPRIAVSDRCGRCHEEAAAKWADSAHGIAVAKGDLDAPVCADCHGAHAIANPDDAAYHVASYAVCARCHGDEKMMERHGLDANTVSSYLRDFHGMSNHLYRALGDTPSQPVATCGDCHGVHAITGFDRSEDPAAVDARIADLCRSCHTGANDGFVTAWSTHTPPSESHRPLVWIVTWVYRLLIPLMLIGLIAHIVLDLWRAQGRHPTPEGLS